MGSRVRRASQEKQLCKALLVKMESKGRLANMDLQVKQANPDSPDVMAFR